MDLWKEAGIAPPADTEAARYFIQRSNVGEPPSYRVGVHTADNRIVNVTYEARTESAPVILADQVESDLADELQRGQA